MPVYEYIAKTIEGNVVKGKMDTVDKAAVIEALRIKNYYPLNIKLHNDSMNVDLSKYKKIPIKHIAIFCRQFSVILAAGIPILRGLEIVKQQTENKKLANILSKAYEDVQRGRTLSSSLGAFDDIPEMLTNMLQVGEASGTMDSILIRMAEYYDKDYKQQQKVKGALTYPTVVGIFSILVVILLVVKVLPTFIEMLAPTGDTSTLPLPTKMIMALSTAITKNGYLMLIGILGIIFLFNMYKKGEEGRYNVDKCKLSIPVFGKISKKLITSRFARTFGVLMSSGVSVLESISICSKVVGNSVIEKVLVAAEEEMRKGMSLGDILERKQVFPPMLTQMIKIGEESGTLDSILEKTAEFYEGEVENATAQLTTLIEPIIIIFLAVVVGFIILSIILPMFEMYNTIG